MQRFDVLVVGGGPAGSTAAIRLADGGARVLLVDKATFPRDKPCGGGITTRAFAHCPVDPTPVVEEEVDLVELRFRYGDSVVREARAPVIRMTQRRRLDAFLLDAARERGVEVREGTTIDAASAPADVVIGADGANGTTAKALGLGGGIVHGVAYEGNVGYDVASRDRYARRAVIELADIPGG
jgi:flavin-dependent dehydrogenase